MKASIKVILVEKIRKALGSRGIHLFRNSIPRGLNFYADLRKAGALDQIRTFIDVGANDGTYSEEGLRSLPGLKRAILIEPEKRNYELLKTRFGNRADLINAAISNCNGYGLLNLSSSDKMHSLSDGTSEEKSNDISSQRVKVETLFDVVNRLNPPSPFFVKIDTEGHDMQVLQGMNELFNEVIAIVIEGTFSRNANITYFQTAHDYLVQKGFLFWGIYDQSPWGSSGSCNVVNGMFINPHFLRS